MPLSSLESQWSVILSNLSTAGNECVKGIDQRDQAMLAMAQSHMTKASEAYLRIVKTVQKS